MCRWHTLLGLFTLHYSAKTIKSVNLLSTSTSYETPFSLVKSVSKITIAFDVDKEPVLEMLVNLSIIISVISLTDVVYPVCPSTLRKVQWGLLLVLSHPKSYRTQPFMFNGWHFCCSVHNPRVTCPCSWKWSFEILPKTFQICCIWRQSMKWTCF